MQHFNVTRFVNQILLPKTYPTPKPALHQL